MKQTFTLFFLFILFISSTNGQTSFSDDFESYQPGDYIAQVSSDWTTWNNAPGSNTDGQVSAEQAASGSNSLKIYATSSGGGPMDILLPFKGTYTSGRFVQKMKIYIAEGKNAYFNYQESPTAGQGWTLNGFLRANGAFEITNSSNASVLNSTFEHNTWLELTIDVNLTQNIWKVLIDDVCIGSFTNPMKNIASMNLYPVDGNSEFFVDDVSFTHEVVAPEINDDLGIVEVNYNGGRLVGLSNSVSYQLINNGKSVINEAELSINVNGNTSTKSLSDLNLAPSESLDLTLDDNITMEEGENKVTISLTSLNGIAGDDEECNNVGSYLTTAVTPAQYKAVIVEEATGTWCQWCPRGAVFMDQLSHAYEGYFIPVAVHNGDPMAVSNYDNYITSRPGFGGFPTVYFNRAESISIPNVGSIENPFLDEIKVPADAGVSIGMDYDDATRTMNIVANVTFLNEMENDVYVNLIITEDGVTGTGSGYAQVNAYAGGGAGEMGGYELLPSPVPASQMVYDHVGRAIYGLQPEVENSLEGPFELGDTRSITFSHTAPNSHNVDNYHIIAVIMNGNEYVNAREVTFEEALQYGTTGVVFNEKTITNVKTYPNPTDDVSNFEITLEKSSEVSIELIDASGKLLGSINHGKQSGHLIIPVNVALLENGVYHARVKTNQGTVIKKIIVQK